MLIKDFLENVCSQIKYKPIREDISEELNLHIQEQKEEYMKDGFEENIAEEKAVSNMGEAEEIGKKLNKIHRPKLDWMLLLLVAILIVFGFLVTIIKANRSEEYNYYLYRHIGYFIIGLIISIGIYFLDYRKVLNHPKIIYGISTFLLTITALFGVSVLGKKYLWITGTSFDIVNLCILLYISAFVGFIKFLDKKCVNINIQNFNFRFRIDIFKLVMLTFVSIFFLIYMRRISISIVLSLSYIIIATVHIMSLPNKKNNLIKLYSTLFVFGIILVVFCLATQNEIYYRIQRGLEATFNFESDLHGNGWMAYQINKVLDNAHLVSGLDNIDDFFGLFDGGTNNALITIIAYYGTAYSAMIIGVVMLFAIKLIVDCQKIKDRSGKLLIVGFGSFILLQSFFNILMNFNLIPITDSNLPFISYGGSAFIINMAMVGFILSIYRRKDILTKKGEESKKIKFKISFE